MDKISVSDARKAEAVGKQVRLQGWVRTRRDSKGGFSFIELNDGSWYLGSSWFCLWHLVS